MPQDLFGALEELAADDRPLDCSLERIATRCGISIEPAVVRKLLDFGILRAAR